MKVTFHTQTLPVATPLHLPDGPGMSARILTAEPMSSGEYVCFTWIEEERSKPTKPRTTPHRATVAKELKQRDAKIKGAR